MALIGTNGEYLRIENIHIDTDYVCTVSYKIYANSNHRQSGDTEFLKSRYGTVNSGILQIKLSENADPLLSIINNLKKQGYESIKADNFEFSSWIDG